MVPTFHQKNAKEKGELFRCAIYTRVSTSERLNQDFNSLDNQREASEAYIESQKRMGWICLPDRYDDGGFTGGNMERPGLKSLMADIEIGRIDAVICYKVDRLSRSLMDFSQLINIFERKNVSFVSVTQHFNTADSMGRLILNILLSFSQFERELTAERIRDKMVAARRKGKWTGGMQILGYDIAPDGGKLIVNQEEAFRVREIFSLYLEHQSLIATVKELNDRDWRTKQWITKSGKNRGGRSFNKSNLSSLLKNPILIGKIKYRDQLFDGEHEAIVDDKIWNQVQSLLKQNGRSKGTKPGCQYNALLKGLIYCGSCNQAMIHTTTLKDLKKRYRYYVCTQAQKQGWDTCLTKSVAAPVIEGFIIDRIREAAKDPSLVTKTFEMVHQEYERKVADLKNSQRIVFDTLKRNNAELRFLMGETKRNGKYTFRLAELQDEIDQNEKQLLKFQNELETLESSKFDQKDLLDALSQFDPIWEAMSLQEQSRIIHLIIERIDYDGKNETVGITFHPSGIKSLSRESKMDQ